MVAVCKFVACRELWNANRAGAQRRCHSDPDQTKWRTATGDPIAAFFIERLAADLYSLGASVYIPPCHMKGILMIGDRIYKGSSTFLKTANSAPQNGTNGETPHPQVVDTATATAAATAAAVAAAQAALTQGAGTIDPAITSAAIAAAQAALIAPQTEEVHSPQEDADSNPVVGESDILSAIKMDSVSTISELAKELSTDTQTVTPIVVDLTARELVKYTTDPGDADPGIELSESGALATRYLNMAR